MPLPGELQGCPQHGQLFLLCPVAYHAAGGQQLHARLSAGYQRGHDDRTVPGPAGLPATPRAEASGGSAAGTHSGAWGSGGWPALTAAGPMHNRHRGAWSQPWEAQRGLVTALGGTEGLGHNLGRHRGAWSQPWEAQRGLVTTLGGTEGLGHSLGRALDAGLR